MITFKTQGLLSMAKEPFGNFYERVGGWSFFTDLINSFYGFVESDPILRPLYPENLEPGKFWLLSFLAQYWGGPGLYSEKRGHPRLRQRHFMFPIGEKQRNAWFENMSKAVKSMEISESDTKELIDYFESTSTFLINQND